MLQKSRVGTLFLIFSFGLVLSLGAVATLSFFCFWRGWGIKFGKGLRVVGKGMDRFWRNRKNSFFNQIRDTYYEQLRIVLTIGVVAGLFPFFRNRFGVFKIDWISLRTLWTLVFYIFSTCSTGYTLMLRIRFFNITDLPFDNYLFNLVFICVVTPHWILLTAALLSAKRMAEYLSMWNEFQRHYQSVTRRTIRLNFKKRATILLMAIVINSICLPMLQTVLLGTFTLSESTSYYYIIFLNGYLCLFWESQCRSLITAVRGLRKSMKEELAANPLEINVKQYRILWQHISDVIKKFSHSGHIIFGCYSMSLYTVIMVSGYCFFSHLLSEPEQIFNNELAGHVVSTFVYTINLFIFCYWGHRVRREVVEFVVDDLLELQVHRLRFSQRKEVFVFLDAVSMNDPMLIVLANQRIGMATIRKYVSSMAMYYIVLFQFKITLPRTG